MLIGTNNYIAFLFKKLFSIKPWTILLPAALLAALVWMDLSRNRALSMNFGDLLMYISQHPGWLSGVVILPLLAYGLSWFALYRQRYPEIREKPGQHYPATGIGGYITGKFGVPGALVWLELRMILRNNRPRSYLVLSFLFLFYGFMFYPKENFSHSPGMMLFIGLLLTGIMMIQYGQLILSWESAYFDRLCTASFSIRDLFAAKYGLFFLFNTVAFVLTAPYALFDFRILLLNLVSWLFNCGVNIFVILYLGTYNTKRVDLGKGVFFNYEGASAVHFLMILPVNCAPVLIYWLTSLVLSPAAGLAVVGILGLAGMIFHRQLMDIVSRQFISRKQVILHGFRNG